MSSSKTKIGELLTELKRVQSAAARAREDLNKLSRRGSIFSFRKVPTALIENAKKTKNNLNRQVRNLHSKLGPLLEEVNKEFAKNFAKNVNNNRNNDPYNYRTHGVGVSRGPNNNKQMKRLEELLKIGRQRSVQ